MRFSERDLALFSAASGDVNPLHLSEAYAHRTPYGERVVFGCLGALAALGAVPARPGQRPVRVAFEFRNPMALGVRYDVSVEERADRLLLTASDAGRVVLRGQLTWGPTSRPSEGSSAAPASAPGCSTQTCLRTEAPDLDIEDLTPGRSVAGCYELPPGAFEALLDRFGVDRAVVDPTLAAALCWSSYLVGMELPGRRAMFWRLELQRTDGAGDDASGDAGFHYDATVADLDRRVDVVTVEAALTRAGRPLAAAMMRAFVRLPSPASTTDAVAALLAPSGALAERSVVLTGGSRGLGAALTRALALQGATVLLGHRHGVEEAEQVKASLGAAGRRVHLEQGDASAPSWAQEVARRAAAEHGGIDVVICNASPPIGAMALQPASLDRYGEFVATSLALVSGPVAAMVPEVARRKGWLVVVSSSALSAPPADWPHYVTAKAAVEGLASWAASRYRELNVLVVRPPKLLTDQVNTPMGRRGAQSVEHVAVAIARRLTGDPVAGPVVEVLDSFSGG